MLIMFPPSRHYIHANQSEAGGLSPHLSRGISLALAAFAASGSARRLSSGANVESVP